MENKQKKQIEAQVSVTGRDLPISTKKAIVLCKILNNKKLEPSMKFFEGIASGKQGVTLVRREALKPNKGTKHPIKTAEVFVKLLKSLNANATNKGLDTSKIILGAKADKAASPMKPGNRLRKFKRSHVTIIGKVMEKKK